MLSASLSLAGSRVASGLEGGWDHPRNWDEFERCFPAALACWNDFDGFVRPTCGTPRWQPHLHRGRESVSRRSWRATSVGVGRERPVRTLLA
jgi:hypothetical protein